jgi:hypothetical protein
VNDSTSPDHGGGQQAAQPEDNHRTQSAHESRFTKISWGVTVAMVIMMIAFAVINTGAAHSAPPLISTQVGLGSQSTIRIPC